MVKTIGCKISDKLYYKIIYEIRKIEKTKSEFVRMLINNYFKDRSPDENNQVNRLTTVVNQPSKDDQYETTKKEVNSFLKDYK